MCVCACVYGWEERGKLTIAEMIVDDFKLSRKPETPSLGSVGDRFDCEGGRVIPDHDLVEAFFSAELDQSLPNREFQNVLLAARRFER